MAENYLPTGVEHAFVHGALVGVARDKMRSGLSPEDAAYAIGARPRDLDLALWHWLGDEVPSAPEPMFEN